MSRDTTERTDACHVVTCRAVFDSDIPKGTAVVFVGDYLVDNLPDQDTFAQGVTLEAHASGVYECVPVVIPGPVLNVPTASGQAAIDAGDLVNGSAAEPGLWLEDANDPAGFALIGGNDGDYIDICFIGEQY